MKINLSLSTSAEDQFEQALTKIGMKKTSDSEHKDSGAQKMYFEGDGGAEVFVMHNPDNDFLRVAYKAAGDKETQHSQGTVDDVEKFIKEVTTALGKGDSK